MAYDTVEGDIKEVAGKVQSKAGDTTGNHEMRAEGTLRDLSGQAQSFYGSVKAIASDMAGSLTNMAGDRLGRENTKALQNAVQKYPLAAIGLAALLGYLLAGMTTK